MPISAACLCRKVVDAGKGEVSALADYRVVIADNAQFFRNGNARFPRHGKNTRGKKIVARDDRVPGITKEAAVAAAKLAGIYESVSALPNGYGTVCADGTFSQGEWQLLSIARAAAANPKVLLLDEITANLDAATAATFTFSKSKRV